MVHRSERQSQAREEAQREASVPLETRRRDAAEGEHAVATIEAESLGRVREKLRDSIGLATQRAERMATLYRGRRKFKPEDASEFFGATQRAADLYERDQRLAKMEKAAEKRAAKARVVAERDPYGKGSPHSWISDCLAASDTSGETRFYEPGWAERLQRHGLVVARAVEKQNGYGRKILAQRGQDLRSDNIEQNRRVAEKAQRDYASLLSHEYRALTTGGGATASASGGGVAAFVAPAILLDQFATYRSPFASFASQLNDTVDLPPFGLTAYVPVITSATSVTTATEGGATSEADPTMGFASGAIVQKSGQVTVSQAVLDRVGPGISGDVVIFTQLKDQLAAQVDLYAIQQALAGAATVTNSGSFAVATATGVGGFVGDLKKAKSKLTDTAGIRLRATHAFAQDDLVDYVCSWADASGRPIVTPAFDDNRLPIRSDGDSLAEGYSGYVLGGLALFGDSNIPTTGGTSNLCQTIVCRPDNILLLEGPPVTYIRPQFQAGNLEPVVGVYEYATAIAKFPSGVAAISGSAYAASTFA
jgi:hypothetical protein